MPVLRLPLQSLWQQLSESSLWQPPRLAIAGSILLHGIILAWVRVPDPTTPPIDNNEIVELVNIPAELEANLPSLEPLLPPTGLPKLDTAPQPLPFTGIEPPPLSFNPLTPLPPLPPSVDQPAPPKPLTFQPLPPPLQLPPPSTATPKDDVATAPELVPSPTPNTSAPEPLATTAGEAAAALARWFNKARVTLNSTNIAIDLSRRVTDLYPPEACRDKLQGQVTVAAVVTPNGELLAANAAPETGLLTQNPQIIRTSGSALLDKAAITAVKKQTFPATGQYQALGITFDFQYRPEICTGTSPTPRPSPSPQPAPPSQPSPQPQPTVPPPPKANEPTSPPTDETPPTSTPEPVATPESDPPAEPN